MNQKKKVKNNIIELGRFVYSLLVVGYHIQLSYDNKDDNKNVDPFENGALAVEYYFLLSGYFLARSLEKLSLDESTSFFRKVFEFMKNKIKAILNVHLLSIVVKVIILACLDTENFADKFVPGIPSIFLVHMIIIWSEDYNKALIIPELYISSMLLCMLFMVPIFLLCKKSMRGIFATLILLGVLAIIVIIFGLCSKWTFNQNFVYDLRAWGEMVVGMFSYYLSIFIIKKTFSNCTNIFFKIVEIVTYLLPVILGIIPISSDYQAYLMMVAVVCIFLAIVITFSNKGNIIENEMMNNIFGYLGSISLPIYLFHPVIIDFIDYIYEDCPKYAKYLLVFFAAIILAFLYRIIANYLNKKISHC